MLPSPLFAQNSSKPVAEVPPRVRPVADKTFDKTTTHFVAYCKFCREGFPSDNDLFQHRKNHERCPYDDCKFNASGKVVAEHISRVHLKTNALVKIQDLTTPEQIEKWREERRKRYPTTANVLLRQQAREERFSRGEKLHDKQQRFGDFQQRNHIRNLDNQSHQNQPKRNRHQKKNFHQRSARGAKPDAKVVEPVQAQAEVDSSDDDSPATPRFCGTSKMKDYHAVGTVVKEQAALSVLGMYGSDSESEEIDSDTRKSPLVEPEVVQVSEVEPANELSATEPEDEHTDSLVDATVEDLNGFNDDDDEAPDEAPIEHKLDEELPETATSSDVNTSRKRKHDNRPVSGSSKPRSALDYSKLRKTPSANPFLEKLLQEDMRHERNILLQCVSHVVKKNFFGVGHSMKAEAEKDDSEVEKNIVECEKNL